MIFFFFIYRLFPYSTEKNLRITRHLLNQLNEDKGVVLGFRLVKISWKVPMGNDSPLFSITTSLYTILFLSRPFSCWNIYLGTLLPFGLVKYAYPIIFVVFLQKPKNVFRVSNLRGTEVWTLKEMTTSVTNKILEIWKIMKTLSIMIKVFFCSFCFLHYPYFIKVYSNLINNRFRTNVPGS